ncbi:TetR/AcrR family transcriptional regulator [Shimazuella kribbensis]|uniref:TetR/AcrR family transcriptional regulator n=1 Tax=Shimazuella kribbensis TaxID=139808 RepID=UPI00040E64A6|nr:TetR/AcrR family transcriptional regulator [Shimazuella kribbensis]
MSPLSEEQFKQIRDKRIEQILSVGLKIFARKGYIGTKLSTIASEAGISKGLLYHYYKSKDEFLETLIHNAIHELENGIKEMYQSPGTPLEKLRSMIEFKEEDQLYFLLTHQVLLSDEVPDKLKRIAKEHFLSSQLFDQMVPLFKEGQELGEFAPGDPNKIVSSFFTVLSGLMALNLNNDEEFIQPDPNVLIRMLTGRP